MGSDRLAAFSVFNELNAVQSEALLRRRFTLSSTD